MPRPFVIPADVGIIGPGMFIHNELKMVFRVLAVYSDNTALVTRASLVETFNYWRKCWRLRRNWRRWCKEFNRTHA